MSLKKIMGPGFFIFFSQKRPRGSSGSQVIYPQANKRKEEDEDILFFIQTTVTRGLI